MSVSEDQTLRLWQIKKLQHQSLAGHGDSIWHLAFNNYGQLFSSSVDRWLNVWQQQGDGEASGDEHRIQSMPVQQFTPDNPHVLGLAIHNKEVALTFRSGRVQIWQVEDWATEDRLPVDYPPSQILEAGVRTTHLAYSPDGQRLAVAASDNSIKFWQRGKDGLFSVNSTTVVENIDSPEVIAFSPDGKFLAIGSSDRTLTLLNADGSQLKTIEGFEAAVVDAVFSPDGQWLATASRDRHLQLWSVADLLFEPSISYAESLFAAEKTQIAKITFTADSRLLISALADGTLSVWDRSSKTLLRTLWGHESALNTVAMSPDGKLIASAGLDRKIILWNLPEILAQDEVAIACEWVSNYLQYNPNVAADRGLCDTIASEP